MDEKQPYSKREMDSIHDGLHKKLDAILKQTTLHNGRLTKLERFVWTISGGIAIFGLIEFDKIMTLFK